MKQISLLGATGSIGTQTLEVIAEHPEHFKLTALSFGENIDKGAAIIHKYRPELVAVKSADVKERLAQQLNGPMPRIVVGLEGMIDVATTSETDLLVNAVMGSIGLKPTIEAIKAGKSIALANKETLVTAGHLVMELADRHQVSLLPVDSEHSAILQALNGEKLSQVNRLILTASGGSFRDKTREELRGVTVRDALNHPNWSMGAKITIDSATMMNKGLEVIEAHWLFHMPYDQIDVVLHKESMVHSLVEYIDKSVLAQLGHPDMRETISYALSYPNRLERKHAKTLNLWEIGQLHFERMDVERFKALKLAYEAGRIGGTATTVLNAANEVAVQAFLENRIEFLEIDSVIERALERHERIPQPDLETVLETDVETRRLTAELISHNG